MIDLIIAIKTGDSHTFEPGYSHKLGYSHTHNLVTAVNPGQTHKPGAIKLLIIEMINIC